MDTIRGIHSTCAHGHSQDLYTPHMGQQEALSLAGLLDGTHPLYRHPPRDVVVPSSTIGRCGICGTWITCVVFGYEEPEPQEEGT